MKEESDKNATYDSKLFSFKLCKNLKGFKQISMGRA
jgi:hypothetical protein